MFHLGWFLTTGFGVYGWNQPWSGNVRADVGRPGLYAETASALERAGFDYMMFEDSSVVPDIFQGSFESSVSRGQAIRFDPMPLMPLLAAATEHIGLIATASTSFYPPFLAARLFQTLDHLTEGRIGINLVTSSPHQAAQNYGLDQHYEHDLRYEMAEDWMGAVEALWQTWEPDAWTMDETSGLFADHTRIHHADYHGPFHSTRGPLNLPPGPQRRPVICQAGGSGPGRDLGARYADTIVSAVVGVDAMKEYRSDISRRAAAFGRDPSEIKVLYLVAPVLADTDEEAKEKQAAQQAAQRANVNATLAAMSYFTSMDFSRFELDEPMPDLSENNGHRTTMTDMMKSGTTLREIAANHRTTESIELVGCPDTVAGQMAEAMEHAGGDGFLIASPVTRKNVSEIADGLAPALRRRGLIRDGYPGRTFRENLLQF